METVTLIIGAGASKDLNPSEIGSGADLIRDISDRVTDRTSPPPNKPNLSDILLNKHFHRIDAELTFPLLSHFVYRLDHFIKTKTNPSIDEFLNEIETYPEYEKLRADLLFIGYFAIVFHILGYEGKAKEKLDEPEQWLFELKRYIDRFNILSKNPEKRLNIITFNYDRILEYFLHQHYKEACMEFCSNNIIHVYKRIGRLEWESPTREEGMIPFASPNNETETFEKHINDIELMYRNRKNLCEVKIAKKMLIDSDSVYCFGYGFDKINNRLLELSLLERIGENLKANIYPGGDPHFTYRREMAEITKSISQKADIHYKSCKEFLTACLFQEGHS